MNEKRNKRLQYSMRLDMAMRIDAAIIRAESALRLLNGASEIHDSFWLTLAIHDAQNLLDKLHNLKQHQDAG